MKFNLSFKFTEVYKLLLKRLGLVLWIFLGLVLLATGFVAKDSVSKILTIEDQSEFAGAQLIRVNFKLYDSIEKRLNENAKYVPQDSGVDDPFGQPFSQ